MVIHCVGAVQAVILDQFHAAAFDAAVDDNGAVIPPDALNGHRVPTDLDLVAFFQTLNVFQFIAVIVIDLCGQGISVPGFDKVRCREVHGVAAVGKGVFHTFHRIQRHNVPQLFHNGLGGVQQHLGIAAAGNTPLYLGLRGIPAHPGRILGLAQLHGDIFAAPVQALRPVSKNAGDVLGLLCL